MQAFHDATKATEGYKPAIDKVFLTMDFLLDHFKTATKTYANNLYMASCIKMGWAKLDGYYSKTDRSTAYTAALVLNPQWKWDYFVQL